MTTKSILSNIFWFILESLGLLLVLIIWTLALSRGYLFMLLMLSLLGYVLITKKIVSKIQQIQTVYPPFMMRIITSIILLSTLITIYSFASPHLLAIIIGSIYGYALIIEYITLMPSSPAISTLTSILLITTGVIHSIWASEINTHIYLGICILTAVLSDVGGYCVGTLWGKHKIAPNISPKKTWEGLAGSILTTSFGLSLVVMFWAPQYNPWLFGLLGAVLAVAGLCGDLLFSYIKRAAGVKDTGTLLPGHGGLLDRIDSIVGTTTIFVLILLLLKASNQINLFY